MIKTARLGDASADTLMLLGHGAGTGIDHPGMVDLAEALAAVDVATLRYEFPYRTAGKRFPDPKPTLFAAFDEALEMAAQDALPLYVGGRSMSGRIASMRLAEQDHEAVRGIVFYGFPLYPQGKPSITRAEHLDETSSPLLFLSGDRDALADLPRLRGVVDRLGDRAQLQIVEGADHSFNVLKRSGRTRDEVYAELARETRRFIDRTR